MTVEAFCVWCFLRIYPGQDTGDLNGFPAHKGCVEDYEMSEMEAQER